MNEAARTVVGGALGRRGRVDDRECCRRGAGNTGGKRGGQRMRGRQRKRGAFRGSFGWASRRGGVNQAVEAGSQKLRRRHAGGGGKRADREGVRVGADER